MDTSDRRGDEYKYHPSSGLDRHHDHHRYHPYRRSDRRYISDEFKKENPPTFDGGLKKPEEAEAWILGMKKLFELHEYSDNMNSMIYILILRGRANIWWEDVKWVRHIRTDELS